MKRKLTERQAWLMLAKAWEKAKGDRPLAVVKGYGADGLCGGINTLSALSRLRKGVEEEMNDSISLLRPTKDAADFYKWSLNANGAKQRAAFCRKMAAKCAAKNRKAKVQQ